MSSARKMLATACLLAFLTPSVQASPVCIDTTRIDHTSYKDPKTVLFYMKDGRVWRNTLQNACPALNFHGFVMNDRGGNGLVCSNQQSISVIETHETCMLGEFTPYAPPEKAPPAGKS